MKPSFKSLFYTFFPATGLLPKFVCAENYGKSV